MSLLLSQLEANPFGAAVLLAVVALNIFGIRELLRYVWEDVLH